MYKETGRRIKEEREPKLWLHILAGIGALLFLFCMIGIALIGFCCLKAPDLSDYDPSPEEYCTVILDEEGEALDTSGMVSKSRAYVSLDEIPEEVQKCFLDAFDPDFYEEWGLEPDSITRKLLEQTIVSGNKQSSGRITRIIQWIQEEYLIFDLERKHSRDWIFEKFLNTLTFGQGTLGIREASIYYFQVLPENLTKDQAQTLIQKAQTADESDVPEITSSDWFLQALLENVLSDLQTECGYSKTEAWNALYNGGLCIYSTENSALQKICRENAEKTAYIRNQEQVSILMTDTATGAVMAVIGGRQSRKISGASDTGSENQDNGFGEYGEEIDAEIISGRAGAEDLEQVELSSEETINRATQLRRQPGNTLAVLGQYAAGLDSGNYTLASVLDDAPCTNQQGDLVDEADAYHVGKLTIHEAIHTGNRTAAYQAYLEIGEQSVKETLSAFGLSELMEESDDDLALGETESGITNLELNAAYGAIARGGSYIEPYFYTKVTDQSGKILLENKEEKSQVIKETTAQLLTISMEDVFAGSTTYEKVNNVEVAGISCCTENGKDAWFAGYSPYYTCTVWGGNDDGSAQEDCTYVKQLWREIMDEAHQDISGAADKELVDTDNLVKTQICTKCGFCAVSGLCDISMQGNMTEEEYFLKGTAPKVDCTCHVKVKVCMESEKLATSDCPSDYVITRVYLKEASEETEDAYYCEDQVSTESCDIHSGIFGNIKRIFQ